MDAPHIPPPTQQQARIIWLAVTAMSLAIFLAVVGLIIWGLGWMLERLTPVLLPLAMAGIMAYILDPVVDFLEARGMNRAWAILLVFFLGVALVVGISVLVLPRLLAEGKDLADKIPSYFQNLTQKIQAWLTE